MTHENCIFCKIINGEIPSAKVYEDEHVYAFLDISQVTKGHTLVIPKIHTTNIYDTPADVAGKLFAHVPRIANAIRKVFKPAGMNILNNNEKAANQTVFHLHFHLIPKYENEQGFEYTWKTNEEEYSSELLTQIANKIHSEIKSNLS